jgi:chitinase
MRHALARRLLLGATTLALGLAGVIAIQPTANAVGETASFTKVSDWGSGWEGKYTIRNGGSATITSWRVEFDLPAGTTITTHWDAQRASTGNHHVFTNASWNGTLAPGATTSFGFNGAGAGAPTNCRINTLDCGGGGIQVPGTPGNPSVTGTTSSSISLSWGASSGTVTGYRVYEGNTVVTTSTTTSATVSGLAAGSTHTYTIAAFNSAGESARSASVTGTANSGTGAPGTPTNFRVTAVTSNSITLAWNASANATGYRIREGNTVLASPTGTTATISGMAACTSRTFTITAFNATAESPRSNPVTGTTSGCTTGPLPRHFLTGYWHNFNNGSTVMRLRDVPAAYDVIAVAFADATGSPGAITFNIDSGLSSSLGGYTNADFTADIQTLHARGKKVILSVGGQNGTISVGDSTAANNFANTLRSLITQFGFDGVDIDLENGVNAQFMGQALRSVRNSVGANFIITMAPQTIDMQSTGMQYFQLALNIRDILTVVHMQYYNSGSMLGCDQQVYSQGSVNFMTALACIQLENGLRPDQVALGLPAGPGAAGGGVIAPSQVNNALNCLARGQNCGSFVPPRTYPDIRGAMTWSINWDVRNGNNFANTVRPFLNTLP